MLINGYDEESLCPEVMIIKYHVICRMQWPIFLQLFIALDIKARSNFNINVCYKREKIKFWILEIWNGFLYELKPLLNSKIM
jgi:hypothetical protein